MTRNEFSRLFSAVIEKAAETARGALGRELPRQYRIRLHGAGHSGAVMDIGEALDRIFLGEETFYAIIDVAVLEVSGSATTLFVRVSAHEPVPFERTWNTPPGSGPFKLLFVPDIRVVPGP